MSDMEKNKIMDEELDSISGGMLLDTHNTPIYDAEFPYAAVNNNTGVVMARFKTPQDAEQYANSFGKDNSYNAQWVAWGVVDYLQKNPNTQPQ